MWQDKINGLYELLGAPFILMSIVRLYKQKKVRGINWIHPAFFTSWGIWNLYYYPCLEQWCSFAGTITIVSTNMVWVTMMLYYIRKEKHDQNSLS